MHAYAELFDAGYAHSFEVWNERGELAGGGYGVAIGRVFITESQVSREPNTSKMGFAALNWHLAHWGFAFNDGKLMTPTCHDMGFSEIPRDEYLRPRTGRAPTRQVGALASRIRIEGSRGGLAAGLVPPVIHDRTEQRNCGYPFSDP